MAVPHLPLPANGTEEAMSASFQEGLFRPGRDGEPSGDGWGWRRELDMRVSAGGFFKNVWSSEWRGQQS